MTKTNAAKHNNTKLSVSEFLTHYTANNRVHPKSLISTFFGDLACPSGGAAWVESIAQVLAPLGISNRLVRTSLFRLVEEQWLHSTRSGRRSYYQLTAKGSSQTDLAEKVIYSHNRADWDGAWTMVFIVMEPVDKEARRQLEEELGWIGFGAVSKYVLAHPTASTQLVADRVRSLGLSSSVVCMRAETIYDESIGLAVNNREMAARCFSISELESRYRRFIDLFSCLDQSTLSALASANDLGNRDINLNELISLRLLLIDEFRRITLQDPNLPEQLLPTGWSSSEAYQLCKTIYLALLPHTQKQYRKLIASAGNEVLRDQAENYRQRFIA